MAKQIYGTGSCIIISNDYNEEKHIIPDNVASIDTKEYQKILTKLPIMIETLFIGRTVKFQLDSYPLLLKRLEIYKNIHINLGIL